MKPANLLRRLIAHIFDLSIIAGIWFICSAVIFVLFVKLKPDFLYGQTVEVYENTFSPDMFAIVLLTIILFSSIFHFYFISMESATGQTFGKRLMRIKVVSIDGSPISKKQAISRDFSKIYFELMLTVPLLYIFMNENRQRLGDKWAKTIVIEHLE